MNGDDLGPILVVDRDAVTRRWIEEWLADTGHTFISTDRATAAIPRLTRELSLVIVAVEPNDLTDLVALARIRELPEGRDVKVLCTTKAVGSGLERVKMTTSQIDVSDYIPKPIDPERLRLAVRVNARRTQATTTDDPTGALTEREIRRTFLTLGAQDHFERLGVARDAEPVAIRKAFLRRVQRYNPESVEGADTEIRRMLRGIVEALNQAFTVLRDPLRRKTYRDELEGNTRSGERAQVFPRAPERRARRPEPAGVDEARPPERPVRAHEVEPPPSPRPPPEPAPAAAPPARHTAPSSEPALQRVEPRPGAASPGPAHSQSHTQAGPPRPTLLPPGWSAAAPRPSDPLSFKPPGTGVAGLPPPPPPPAARQRSDSQEGAAPPIIHGQRPTAPIRTASEEELSRLWDNTGRGREKPAHEMLANAAQLQIVMGDYSGAVDLLEQAVRLAPNDQELKYKLELNLGRKHREIGHRIRAVQHFEAAIALAPKGMTAAADELAELEGSSSKGGGLFGSWRKKK